MWGILLQLFSNSSTQSFLILGMPSNPVLLSFSVAPLGGTAYGTIVRARPPAAAPAGGGVACRVPAPGLPPSSSMPRGPPSRAPPFFPEDGVGDGNRMGVDSCAPVCPTAASGPGFHVRWPPSDPRVSARAIPVSAGGRGPPADASFPPVSMILFRNVINGNLVDHNMKGIEYASCFETLHLISFLNVDCLDPVINSGSHNGVSIRLDYIHLREVWVGQ